MRRISRSALKSVREASSVVSLVVVHTDIRANSDEIFAAPRLVQADNLRARNRVLLINNPVRVRNVAAFKTTRRRCHQTDIVKIRSLAHHLEVDYVNILLVRETVFDKQNLREL